MYLIASTPTEALAVMRSKEKVRDPQPQRDKDMTALLRENTKAMTAMSKTLVRLGKPAPAKRAAAPKSAPAKPKPRVQSPRPAPRRAAPPAEITNELAVLKAIHAHMPKIAPSPG